VWRELPGPHRRRTAGAWLVSRRRLFYGGVGPCLGDEPHARVQLAAGHRRLRAFQHLHTTGSNGEYATFPVDIQILNDQAMADIAWEENARRKNLSPIEEAQALQQALDRFGWTQTELGQRWGLSQSAVANKLRLLKLPTDAQRAIRSGQISERHGRALLKAAGKSLRIYARAAEAILPDTAPPKAAEKARAMIKASHYWQTHTDNNPRCHACGRPATRVSGQAYQAILNTGVRSYLCLACYRAATGWSPPSATEAEQAVQRAIRNESKRLDIATWPLDEIVGQGDPQIRSARCTGCHLRETSNGTEWCLDRTCFRRKEDVHWYGYLVTRLREHLQATFNATAPAHDGHAGHAGYDLLAEDEIDVSLIQSGTCAPGKCKRLRFRHVTYESSRHIRPCPDLPFIYNCDNTSSHRACQRRHLKNQQTQNETAAQERARRATETRQKNARALLTRAQQGLAQALLAGHPGVWHELARRVDQRPKDGQPATDSAHQVAAWLLLTLKQQLDHTQWSKKDSGEQFTNTLHGRMAHWGVAIPPTPIDLVHQIEQTERLIFDRADHPRPGLTPEQISSNINNVNKISIQLEKMHQQISTDNYYRLAKRLAALEQTLKNISREITGPGP